LIAVGCGVLVAGVTQAETPQGTAPAVESKAEAAPKEAEPAAKPAAKPKPEGSSSGKSGAPGKFPNGAKPGGPGPKGPALPTPAKPFKPAASGGGGASKPSGGAKPATAGTAGSPTKSQPRAVPAAKAAAGRDLTPASVDTVRHRGANPPVLGGVAAGTVRSTAALNGTGMRNRNVLK